MKFRRYTFMVLGVSAAVALIFLLQPAPPTVEVSVIAKGPFVLTVEDQGRTRARKPFIVAAPISGKLLRTDLTEGDEVRQGETIGRIALSPQDQRTVAMEKANLAAAEAQLRAEVALSTEAEGLQARALRELERRRELVKNKLSSREEVESFQQAVITAAARVESSKAAVEAASANVESVKSRLLGSTHEEYVNTEEVIELIIAPSNGTVLNVLEESERVVLAGTPLFEISNEDNLEVVVDLLTQDAVKVTPGDEVLITGWGGEFTINGFVRFIEPAAFTKFSALGVEEQRVNVVIDLIDAPANLGAEYRVEVAIVIWESDQELTVPASALFQSQNGWNVFAVEDSKVVLRQVELGRRNRSAAQVFSGLNEGDLVISYPSDIIQEGLEVVAM